MSIRIGEKIKYAINPLPNVSDEDVLKRAGLTKRRPVSVHPFEYSWKVGSGVDTQHFHITPTSEPLPLRGSREWRIFESQWGEWGGILVNEDATDEEIRDLKVQGLQRAYDNWQAIGEVRADNYQIVHGLTDEQMERQRGQIWRWYYNEALAEFIGEEIERLLNPPASKRAAAKKDAEEN